MLILALDVGTWQTGYCWYDTDKSAPSPSSTKNAGKVKNEEILQLITWDLYDAVIIEDMVSWSNRVGATTRTTLMWMGRFIQAAEFAKKPWHLLGRDKVKKTFGLKTNCTDKVINDFIKALYVPGYNQHKNPGILKGFTNDSFAALEVATAFAIQRNLLK